MWTLIKELCKKLIIKEIQINKIIWILKKVHILQSKNRFQLYKLLHANFIWVKSGIVKSNQIIIYLIKNNTEIGLWLKYFFGLGFLPPEQVDDGFAELISVAPTNNHTFTGYILENYINKESQFPPNIWAETPINNIRTTNGSEAFHKHFNVQFYHPHPNIHHVVDVLTNIQTETTLKINSIKKINSITLKKR